MQTHSRLHYMDNLRALLMILGVFFHVALAYSPLVHSVWLTADKVNSPWVDYLLNFLHMFRMPLFFTVAGFFAALLVQRRGLGGMLKNRVVRVLVPFVLFWPLIVAAIMLPIGWALENVHNLSPILTLVASYPDAPPPPPSTTHLWFLYYLMFFYILAWVIKAIIPVTVKEKILELHPVAALGLLPLLLIPGLSMTTVPIPAPESFIPQLWAFGFHGLFFAWGYLLFSSFKWVDYFRRYWLLLVLASVALFIPLQYLYPRQVDFNYSSPPWPTRMILIIGTAYISVLMSVAGLAFAQKVLDKRNIIMGYLSDSSYWIYIVHLPIVFAIQYCLLDQEGGLLFKYSVSVVLTFVVCLASYFILVRWTPLGWLLNGKRPVRGVEQQASTSGDAAQHSPS